MLQTHVHRYDLPQPGATHFFVRRPIRNQIIENDADDNENVKTSGVENSKTVENVASKNLKRDSGDNQEADDDFEIYVTKPLHESNDANHGDKGTIYFSPSEDVLYSETVQSIKAGNTYQGVDYTSFQNAVDNGSWQLPLLIIISILGVLIVLFVHLVSDSTKLYPLKSKVGKGVISLRRTRKLKRCNSSLIRVAKKKMDDWSEDEVPSCSKTCDLKEDDGNNKSRTRRMATSPSSQKSASQFFHENSIEMNYPTHHYNAAEIYFQQNPPRLRKNTGGTSGASSSIAHESNKSTHHSSRPTSPIIWNVEDFGNTGSSSKLNTYKAKSHEIENKQGEHRQLTSTKPSHGAIPIRNPNSLGQGLEGFNTVNQNLCLTKNSAGYDAKHDDVQGHFLRHSPQITSNSDSFSNSSTSNKYLSHEHDRSTYTERTSFENIYVPKQDIDSNSSTCSWDEHSVTRNIDVENSPLHCNSYNVNKNTTNNELENNSNFVITYRKQSGLQNYESFSVSPDTETGEVLQNCTNISIPDLTSHDEKVSSPRTVSVEELRLSKMEIGIIDSDRDKWESSMDVNLKYGVKKLFHGEYLHHAQDQTGRQSHLNHEASNVTQKSLGQSDDLVNTVNTSGETEGANGILHKRSDLTAWTDAASSLTSPIQFSELKMITIIGGGGFGQVWQAKWQGTPVAVKVLSASAQVKNAPKAILEEFAAEINMLSGMRHPNVCLYIGACLQPPNRAIVTELAANGSLWDALRLPLKPPFEASNGITRSGWPIHLYNINDFDTEQNAALHKINPNDCKSRTIPPLFAPPGAWPWILMKHVAAGAARGMNYLHCGKPPVLHRDLKSANILLNESYNAKVADFGLSRLKAQERSMTGNCGTVQWMAPEILANQKYAEPADVYSYGIILWELLCQECPYDGMSPIQCALAVLNNEARPEIPKWCPPFLKSLIENCLDSNPLKRPTFERILHYLDSEALDQHE